METYEARGADGAPLWKAEVDLGGSISSNPFRGHAVWAEAGVVAIGGESTVVLLALASGAERSRIQVPSLFGSASVDRVGEEEWLFIMGWRDVHAFGPDLRERWTSRDVAVDGVTGAMVDGDVLEVRAEMDPPGGWFDVQLDVRTGREMRRAPAFTDDYCGIYGAGRNARGG